MYESYQHVKTELDGAIVDRDALTKRNTDLVQELDKMKVGRHRLHCFTVLAG